MQQRMLRLVATLDGLNVAQGRGATLEELVERLVDHGEDLDGARHIAANAVREDWIRNYSIFSGAASLHLSDRGRSLVMPPESGLERAWDRATPEERASLMGRQGLTALNASLRVDRDGGVIVRRRCVATLGCDGLAVFKLSRAITTGACHDCAPKGTK